MSSGSESEHSHSRNKFRSERNLPTVKKKSKEENVSEDYGPVLPPHLMSNNSNNDMYGPRPPHQTTEPSSSEDIYGPKLPPDTDRLNTKHTYGPKLPDNFKINEDGVSEDSSDLEEDEFVGPDPKLMNSGHSTAAQDVERRALKMKKNLSGISENEDCQRESWMLELPPEKAQNLGLGARQFKRKHTEVGDRSVWTETPNDKSKKKDASKPLDYAELLKAKAVEERDKEMEKLLKKSKKRSKEPKSLLEMHQKKMKKMAKKEAKKKEEAGKPVERRPFDRDIDLQANRFDEAQKRSIIKKAQLLNDRFSQGESKFL